MMDVSAFQKFDAILRKTEGELTKLEPTKQSPAGPSQAKISACLRHLDDGIKQLQTVGKSGGPLNAQQFQHVDKVISKIEAKLSLVESQEKFSSCLKQLDEGLNDLKMLQNKATINNTQIQQANLTVRGMEASLSAVRDLLGRTAYEHEIRQKYRELRKLIEKFKRSRVERKDAPKEVGPDDQHREK